MATDLKRITFVVTSDMDKPLDEIKKDFFYNCTQSEMIRKLIAAGIKEIEKKKEHQGEQL